jgi:integrase
MAKEKLTLAKIAMAYRPGLLNDGGGLYLSIAQGGSKSWCFRFTVGDRRRVMGLGGLDKVNLREARERARECRELVEQGIDPIDHRKSKREAAAANMAMTFKKAALAYIDAHKDGWCAPYAQQWRDHFEAFVFSKIGALPVQAVNNTEIVLRVLEPIWKERTVTAWHIRTRIEKVINWAKFRGGYCTGENAARWKGHLELHLPRPGQIRGVRHHPALPYRDVPGFVQKLRKHRGTAAVALEFTLLTAGRSGETRWARWPEFDLAAGLWTIPAERMKMRREHRVALNGPALAVLREVAWLKRSEDDFVFPGIEPGKPIGQHVMKTLMNLMDYNGIASTHGFRSSFKDWATEQTDFSTEAIELALAHTVGNKVEAAYRRGDLLEKRRLLSKAWGDFCLGLTPLAASNLIPFPEAVPGDRVAMAAPVAANGGSQEQLRSTPLAAQTTSISLRSSNKDRRHSINRATQLKLDF